tara:strand:+ start:2806 stop:3066 length:261 start_codon:yes stop_codon:yes gene_type:complete
MSKKQLTISDVAQLTSETSPYFFDKKTLKFFGQTMRSFKVYKQDDGRYLISAPIILNKGKQIGTTQRYFNPETNELERVPYEWEKN